MENPLSSMVNFFNDIPILFWSIAFALLVDRIVKEMKEANSFVPIKNPRGFIQNVVNFLWRYVLAFVVTFTILYLIAVIIAVLFGMLGFVLKI